MIDILASGEILDENISFEGESKLNIHEPLNVPPVYPFGATELGYFQSDGLPTAEDVITPENNSMLITS